MRRHSEADLQRIDQALTLTQGDRTASAKLLDLPPKSLCDAIRNHHQLREKWAKARRGRPSGRRNLPFYIAPSASPEVPESFDTLLDLVQMKIAFMSDEDREQVKSRLFGSTAA
jgi:hypothetical protein